MAADAILSSKTRVQHVHPVRQRKIANVERHGHRHGWDTILVNAKDAPPLSVTDACRSGTTTTHAAINGGMGDVHLLGRLGNGLLSLNPHEGVQSRWTSVACNDQTSFAAPLLAPDD